MARMKERAIQIDQLENALRDHRAALEYPEASEALLTALKDLRSTAEILAMPEAARCPFIRDLLR